ncbi:hypothetical protein B0J13DRAFT_230794 [Dactylonectria estremocensis]|uniref:Secreted protein n=1 Tax=Dactylonectria estremocensis TaxID=1079267 RepID=A0A9P9F7N6_9HYPO|nr:hypothetical protein B0J13DRAFT_230794 [Dactylonectria estremocensis]
MVRLLSAGVLFAVTMAMLSVASVRHLPTAASRASGPMRVGNQTCSGPGDSSGFKSSQGPPRLSFFHTSITTVKSFGSCSSSPRL